MAGYADGGRGGGSGAIEVASTTEAPHVSTATPLHIVDQQCVAALERPLDATGRRVGP